MSAYDTSKKILGSLPSVVLRPQPATDWSGDYRLPPAIADYYTELGPVDISLDSYGNPYFLPSLANLWSHQVGYRTHGFTHERLLDWNDDWLVIADQGGDPFIFSRTSGAVLHAYHGEGAWKPKEVFSGMPEMATTFAIIGEIVELAGTLLTDEDSLIRERYRNEARNRLNNFTHSSAKTDIILSKLGWSG